MLQRRWSEAEQEFKRAEELNPTLSDVHRLYAWMLLGQGRLDDALSEMQRAVELDPLSPMLNTMLGAVLFYQRRYDEAIAQLNETVALDPTFSGTYGYLAGLYFVLGKYEEAIEACEKAEGPGIPMALAASYAASGRRAEADKMLEKLTAPSSEIYVNPTMMAWLYIWLEEKDRAFDSLEQAYEDYDMWLAPHLRASPVFDPLRSDPRYHALLKKLNLER